MVKVPVLSEQMLLAPPIVSQASSFRTKLLSTNIFLTEKARDKVTARGRPSGMATTTTVKANIKYYNKVLGSVELFHGVDTAFSTPNLIRRIINIRIAELRPNFPIASAIFSSLF